MLCRKAGNVTLIKDRAGVGALNKFTMPGHCRGFSYGPPFGSAWAVIVGWDQMGI